ncbi:MAG TPA: hypothetical protein ENK62_06645 [Chromatiales bacterium]|nr:hypothetical protein [Chromatiales bacterium]
MELDRILHELDEAGVVLELAAGGRRIRWKAPAGSVAPGLLGEMRRRKAALLRLAAPAVTRWQTEVRAWPPEFRAAWCELAESYERAGHPRAAAEYLAWLDLHQAADPEAA